MAAGGGLGGCCPSTAFRGTWIRGNRQMECRTQQRIRISRRGHRSPTKITVGYGLGGYIPPYQITTVCVPERPGAAARYRRHPLRSCADNWLMFIIISPFHTTHFFITTCHPALSSSIERLLALKSLDTNSLVDTSAAIFASTRDLCSPSTRPHEPDECFYIFSTCLSTPRLPTCRLPIPLLRVPFGPSDFCRQRTRHGGARRAPPGRHERRVAQLEPWL